jgi:hypothetical protein
LFTPMNLEAGVIPWIRCWGGEINRFEFKAAAASLSNGSCHRWNCFGVKIKKLWPGILDKTNVRRNMIVDRLWVVADGTFAIHCR